jgi:hypothetical protein
MADLGMSEWLSPNWGSTATDIKWSSAACSCFQADITVAAWLTLTVWEF